MRRAPRRPAGHLGRADRDPVRTLMARARDDSGAAVVEFVILVVLALVPLVYVVLAAMEVQSAAYAVTQGAREAGRAFAQADSPSQALGDARTAARIALADQGFESAPDSLRIDCAGPCLAPGSTVTVRLGLRVALPFLPDSLASSTPGAVPVSAEHVVPIDEYRSSP